MSNFELKVRELLVPVFGLESVDQIQPELSLVNDLNAESLDFVEIIHLVEKNFAVVLETKEIIGALDEDEMASFFQDGRLTAEGKKALEEKFPERSSGIKAGMAKVELFSLLTVRDLAFMIETKMEQKGA